jgi:VanZ family protein
LRLWAPFFFWLAVIFALSAYPRALIPQSKYFSWDKLAHLVEYGILGYLSARAFYFSGIRWLQSYVFWRTLAFGALFGASDELHQYFVKGRYASVYDVIADVVGVLLGSYLFIRLQKRAAAASPDRTDSPGK